MTVLFAETALMPEGWTKSVRVEIAEGRIARVEANGSAEGAERVGLLLPAPGNLHSHAFQRAMAGLTEYRSAGKDNFWSWRVLMYQFLDSLTPEHLEAIAAQVQVEMLEAGFAAICEFHYVHHRPGGGEYDDIGETSARTAAAAAETGIGLTHLPVLYMQGGADGRALAGGQKRFGNDPAAFDRLLVSAERALAGLPGDTVLGVAPHSLRAVPRPALAEVAGLRPGTPVHIHTAEQVAEVEEIEGAYGARPVAWSLDNLPIDERWCLIHATHMLPAETEGLARSGAVAGLCPITEANLGDGIFDGARYLAAGGRFGVGGDCNIRIGLAEELRQLEHSQRLRDGERAVLCAGGKSVGRTLYEAVCHGSARAMGRESGAIAEGKLADLVALDPDALALAGREGDRMLDSWIFAGNDDVVRDVWSAGRHVVREGRHPRREAVEARFRRALADLRAAV